MQEEILHLLGLNYRPQAAPKRRTISSANSTVPTFMKVKYVFAKRIMSGGVEDFVQSFEDFAMSFVSICQEVLRIFPLGVKDFVRWC